MIKYQTDVLDIINNHQAEKLDFALRYLFADDDILSSEASIERRARDERMMEAEAEISQFALWFGRRHQHS